MPDTFSQRLLTLLQLTRMALVFTAISNSLCTALLVERLANPEGSLWAQLDLRLLGLVVLISVGLYGFGMSLNDIIDRRRDRQLASHRPLPSGRIRLLTAHVVCGALLAMALAAGLAYVLLGGDEVSWRSFVLVLWTAGLIIFYDLAGKYLVAPGLITLGLIRFFHCLIPAGHVPLAAHPLTLFAHVTILSAVAYVWEEKRPALTRLHRWTVAGGVAFVIALVLVMSPGNETAGDVGAAAVSAGSPAGRGLAVALTLGAAFAAMAWVIRRRSATVRQAGQALMLAGLLWLIVYDAAFAAAYVGWPYAAALLALLPLSYLSVLCMRWWSKLVLLSQQPEYKRIRTDPRPPEA